VELRQRGLGAVGGGEAGQERLRSAWRRKDLERMKEWFAPQKLGKLRERSISMASVK